jgi:3-hydroxybutyryl-CoA dehydrogenase
MDKIAVVGAGTMGNGIAHVFAQNGFDVRMIDLQAAQLEKALQTIAGNLDRQVQKGTLEAGEKEKTLRRIETFSSLKDGVAGASLVIEAATELEPVKIRIFEELDAFCDAGTILASNTSSISITRIAAATRRPEKVIGMHFMNPVPLMKLVEIINGYSTSEETTGEIVALSGQLGKTPCVVRDYPGFISNRILMPMINEAILCLQESVAGVSTIDTVMKLGMAHPMGPLQLADFIGLDVCLSILRVLHNGFGYPKYAPAALLVNMVAAGKLGVKSGEGFYVYEKGRKDLVVSPLFSGAS